MKGKAADCHTLVRIIRGSKCLATGLDAFWSSLSTLRRCSRKRSPSGLPVSPMYNFLQRVQVMQ